MTLLVWDLSTARRYEAGVSYGVLYPPTGPGVVWNGLKQVTESSVGADVESLYYDGVKYIDYPAGTSFQATLSAYSAPAEFAPCNGELPVVSGVLATKQPRQRFGLCYRTGVNATGYKTHIVYNCLALPSKRDYQSQSNEPTPAELEWVIDAIPPLGTGYKPTAHFVIDSTKVLASALAALEALLYGTTTVAPALPPPATLIGLF